MALERIIITFEKDGSYRGSSATDFDGLPAHLEHADLEALCPCINAAAMIKASETEAADQRLKDIEAAINDTTLDDATTLNAAREIIAGSKLSAREKRQAELEAEIAAKQAELSNLL